MKIIVALKQVPVRDSALRIDPRQRWIDEQDLIFEINEPDAYALEEALLLRDRHGGEVVVLSAGPDRATVVLDLADLLARTVIAPTILPVGVFTALVGAPFFLFLLRNNKRAYRWYTTTKM